MLPRASPMLGVWLAMACQPQTHTATALNKVASVLFASLILWPGALHARTSLVFDTYSPDKPTAMVAQLRPSLDGIAFHMREILGAVVETSINGARLDDRIVAALRDAMPRLENDRALADLRFEGYILGDDSEYAPTREAMRVNPSHFEQVAEKS